MIYTHLRLLYLHYYPSAFPTMILVYLKSRIGIFNFSSLILTSHMMCMSNLTSFWGFPVIMQVVGWSKNWRRNCHVSLCVISLVSIWRHPTQNYQLNMCVCVCVCVCINYKVLNYILNNLIWRNYTFFMYKIWLFCYDLFLLFGQKQIGVESSNQLGTYVIYILKFYSLFIMYLGGRIFWVWNQGCEVWICMLATKPKLVALRMQVGYGKTWVIIYRNRCTKVTPK